MTRTNIDIDDDLVERAMRTFGISTKRQVVQLALERLLGGGPMSLTEQLEMRRNEYELTPLNTMDEVLKEQYVKGELAQLRLVLQFPRNLIDSAQHTIDLHARAEGDEDG